MRLGLIAGCGRMPLLGAEAAKRHGIELVCASIRGETQRAVERLVPYHVWLHWHDLDRLIGWFGEHHVSQAVMLGGIRKVRLLNEMPPEFKQWLEAQPDRRDQALLKAVAGRLQQGGVELIDSTSLLREALAEPGCLTTRQPTARETADIQVGYELARALASADIGMTVVVKERIPLAVEAIEGTDQTILRGGKLGGPGSVVVKVARPHQDWRFDLPVVGPNTIKTMHKVRASCLALEAGRTVLLDRDELLRLAHRWAITVVAHS